MFLCVLLWYFITVHCYTAVHNSVLTDMYRYHTTFNADKKIIATDDKATLYDVVRREFDVTAPVIVQSWDAEFEDWLNVSDVTQLPDKCKLHIVVKGGHH